MGGEEEKQEVHQKGFKVYHTGAACPGTCHRECCGYQSALDAVCAAYGIYTSQLMEPHVIHTVPREPEVCHKSTSATDSLLLSRVIFHLFTKAG